MGSNMEQRQKTVCLKQDACIGENGDFLKTCPENKAALEYVGKTPLVAPERLCLGGLAAHVEKRSKNIFHDTYKTVCYDIDRALALPNVLRDTQSGAYKDMRSHKKEIMDGVAKSLSTIPRLEYVSEENLPTALLLKRIGIFMPVFSVRSQEREPDGVLTKTIHENLVNYIDYLDELIHNRPMHAERKKQVISHRTECEVMGLISRTDIVPYPALEREEASHARKKHNHDFYTLPDFRKKPVQVKTNANGSGYDKVAVIQHRDILRAMRQEPERHTNNWTPTQNHEDYEWPSPYSYEEIIGRPPIDPIGTLLIEEIRQGKRLSPDKRQALNLASSYVLTRI